MRPERRFRSSPHCSSIHSGRSHIPFRSVDGLPDLIQVAFERKLGSSHLIHRIGNSVYTVGGIVAPFVRVADLAHKRGKFCERLLARRRPHPRSVWRSSPSASIR